MSNSRSDHYEAVQWLIEQCSRSDGCRKLIQWAIWCRIERSLQSQEIPLSWAVLIYGELTSPWLHCFWPKWWEKPLPDGWYNDKSSHATGSIPLQRCSLVFWQRRNGYSDEEAAEVLALSVSAFRRQRSGRAPVTRQTSLLAGYFDGHRFPNAWQADYDDNEAKFEERYGRRILPDKLIAGELQTTGFEPGAPLDSPPTPIHPARWRVLVPDFETSSATGPDGVKVVGIRVLPANQEQDPAAASMKVELELAAPGESLNSPDDAPGPAHPIPYMPDKEVVELVGEIGWLPRPQLEKMVKDRALALGKRVRQKHIRLAAHDLFKRKAGRPKKR
jgi:hypothetical protein